jgi:hypothetical protein
MYNDANVAEESGRGVFHEAALCIKEMCEIEIRNDSRYTSSCVCDRDSLTNEEPYDNYYNYFEQILNHYFRSL